jgi:hypothetical protein
MLSGTSSFVKKYMNRDTGAKTIEQYMKAIPQERVELVQALRKLLLDNLPDGYEESMGFGMICYCVPLTRYPTTYNKQPLMVAAIANQKHAVSLHLHMVYGNPDNTSELQEAAKLQGKRLDMGKSCIRLRSLDNLPLKTVASILSRTTVASYIAQYEKAMSLRKN